MTTGDKLLHARMDAGLTQREIADRIGVSESMIWAYERGKRKPKLETINRFAQAIGVDPSTLYGDEIQPAVQIKQALDAQDAEALSKLLGGKVEFVSGDRRREQRMVKSFRKLSVPVQDILLDLVEELADEQV